MTFCRDTLYPRTHEKTNSLSPKEPENSLAPLQTVAEPLGGLLDVPVVAPEEAQLGPAADNLGKVLGGGSRDVAASSSNCSFVRLLVVERNE